MAALQAVARLAAAAPRRRRSGAGRRAVGTVRSLSRDTVALSRRPTLLGLAVRGGLVALGVNVLRNPGVITRPLDLAADAVSWLFDPAGKWPPTQTHRTPTPDPE